MCCNSTASADGLAAAMEMDKILRQRVEAEGFSILHVAAGLLLEKRF